MKIAMMTVLAVAACNTTKQAPDVSVDPTSTPVVAKVDPVERGKYIVTTSGCHDCHTPWKMGSNGPEPDMSRALSGHPQEMLLPPAPALPAGPWMITAAASMTAWSGPWGTSFTANLTPDRATGIGAWTKQNFIDTIRNARHLGNGRPLLPPMPAPVYAQMTDDDLGAIYAYLMTLPPRANKVPEPLPPPSAPAQVSVKDSAK